MDVDLIFRIAAIGIIVSVLYQVLLRAGREEQAMLTSLAGLIVVLMMMIQEISTTMSPAREVSMACSSRPARSSTWYSTETMMPMAAIRKIRSTSILCTS